MGSPAMERFVAKTNIDHYRDLLARELTTREREIIEMLLAEERRKLAELERPEVAHH